MASNGSAPPSTTKSPARIPSATGVVPSSRVKNRKSGPRRWRAVAVVTVFRVDAGMKAVSSFTPTTTLPLPSIRQNPRADPCSPGEREASLNRSLSAA